MTSTPAGPFEVLVAVLTYRRPDELTRILPVLAEQVAALPIAASVVVIDNDPAGGARSAVGSATRLARIDYVHEPRPGIAAARNRALDVAAADPDVRALVFIDDDETPGPGWLAALVDCWQEYHPAAVSAPVVPRYDQPPSDWVTGSRRFERRQRVTGTTVRTGATNNLLLDLDAINAHQLRFDESFGLTGGEDTDLTFRLTRAGGRVVWCDEAEVFDHIPAHRLTPKWVLRRDFRAGTSWSRIEIKSAGRRSARVRTRVSLLARGTVRVLGGTAQWVVGVAERSVESRARGACVAVSNAGLVSGALGYALREYDRRSRAGRKSAASASRTPPADPRSTAQSGRGDVSS